MNKCRNTDTKITAPQFFFAQKLTVDFLCEYICKVSEELTELGDCHFFASIIVGPS